MKKELLQNIINLASFSLSESEYDKFMYYINNKEYNSARLFVDKILDRNELILNFYKNNELLLSQCKMLDSILDIVTELIIVNGRDREKRERIREVIK